jgi:choline monooxygenase
VHSLNDILSSYDPNAPLAEASTIPASWYTDERVFELENQAVFGQSWQVAARLDQLGEPGHYVTTEISGEPVVIVRGSDGELRGFFNVCRHHAAAVMTEAEGRAAQMRCPYHGWTYSLEGELKGTPDFSGVCNFDRAENGLAPVEIATWEKWVFAKVDAKQRPPLNRGPVVRGPRRGSAGSPAEHLGWGANPAGVLVPPVNHAQDARATLTDFFGDDLISQIKVLGFEKLRWIERRHYSLNCNWKVFVDNYLDGGYHVPHLHKGLDSVLDYGSYTIENGGRFCLQSSPMINPDQNDEVGAVRTGRRALYYWLYPNFMMNYYEGMLDTNLVRPLAVDRTEVVFDFYFADVSESARERNLASINVGDRIQQEDLDICESVQRGLSSRAYEAGRLSVRREAGEHLFHCLLYADLKTGV